MTIIPRNLSACEAFDLGAGAGFEPEAAVLTPLVNTYSVASSESQVLRKYKAEGVSSGELFTGYAPAICLAGIRATI
jgi:hypothetical protein